MLATGAAWEGFDFPGDCVSLLVIPGWAIRTETDTCVVAILDERSVPGQRYFETMKAALPEMEITNSLEDVVDFIYRVKGSRYFKEGES